MRYAISAIILSLIVIFGAVWVNVCIGRAYLNADGKTKALFGIIEIIYSFKYYFLLGSLISGILAWKAVQKKEKLGIIACIFVVISILSIGLRMWTWFV